MTQRTRWPDLAGRLMTEDQGRYHLLPVRVYFEDTDFTGVVYHASYLRWCERGRSDLLRLIGNDHLDLLRGGDGREPAAFVVRRMALDFLRPARIDEILHVETRIGALGGAHVELNQTITRDDQPIFSAKVTVVLISLSGKPMRLSATLRDALVTQPPTT